MFFIILILTIAGKVSALIKDILFASLFGASSATDAYFIAAQLPGALWLAIYATIGSVFLPMYVRASSTPGLASSLANEAVRYYLAVAMLLATFCWIFAESLVRIIAPSIDEDTAELAVYLTRIMTCGFFFTGYVGVQSVLQQANREFIPPLAVPVVNNIIATAAIVLAFYCKNIAIAALGAVGAYVVQALIQRKQTQRFYPIELKFGIRRETWWRLSLLSTPMIFAVFLDQANVLIGTSIASSFGSGAISHLNYANRLALFVAGFFSLLVSYLFFPSLASNAALRDDEANATVITGALALIIMSTAPVAVIALALREDVVALIYKHGVFGSADVFMTSQLFGVLGFGIIFTAMREFLNRVYFSYQKTMIPLVIGIVAAAFNVIISLQLSKHYDVLGVAFGSAFAAFVFCAGQIGIILIWKPLFFKKNLISYFVAVFFSVAIVYIIVRNSMSIVCDYPLLLRLMILGSSAVAIYGALLFLFLRMCGVRPSHVMVLARGHMDAK